ncbi:MAG TPA: ATP-binding protein [Chthoniobacterales bacterium]|nr:ATP-binding protein [Chthoniobacterales bacterium]
MTTAVVSFPQLEIKWSRPEQPLVVGKDILELLSTSMYVDPMSMYREYIQNSADAVELAHSAGLIRGPGQVQIRMDQASRTVFIRDNGVGIGKEQFVHQLTALGGSKKRGTGARGFRGVGRLAGLAFCQELIFRTRQNDEKTVHELRWNSRDVRSLLRAADDSSDLREIVAKTVEVREVPGRNWPERFFEVELRGVVRHRDDRLLNDESVANYLGQVAPVPFCPDFQFADQIRSFLEKHGARLGVIELEIAGRGNVYRPHRSSISMGKSGQTQFHELTTIYTPGRDGEIAAATWILHHDYRGSLPSSSLVDGWRVRCGDIQIGDNAILQGLFPETRFNGWCVAETHVFDPRILPNGRRDHFEQNTYYFDLINHLTPHAREIAQRCRTSSIARNLVRSIEERLKECQENVRVIEKGMIGESAASKLIKRLEASLDSLQKLSTRTGISAEQQTRYSTQIKRLRQKLLKLNSIASKDSAFARFKPDQRSILAEVFNVIYQSSDDLQEAQTLIDKILGKLKRGHTGARGNSRRQGARR